MKVPDHQKTRDLSVREGVAASVMGGAGDSYVGPFAMELGASNLQMGQLTSYAGLFGPVAQVLGSKLMEIASRRVIIFWGVFLQALVWLTFIILGYWFLVAGKTPFLVPLVILAYILYQLTGAVAGPPWFSMMGEVVPESIRGKYFAWRNFLSVGTSVGTTILASVFLFYARSFGWLIYGFIVLFAIAAVARFISANYLRRHEVGPITFSKNYHFSFWRFLRRAPYNNFGRFSIFVAAFNFAVNIGGPFFGVYLWRDLGFNPIWYILITSSLGLFSALSMPVWGRLADRYGNRELLKLGSGLIAIGSLVWGFSRNPLYFIFVPELLFGVGWAAFNLATGNYIYDAVTPERRGLCLAYYSLLNGVGVFLGALTGGFLAEIITFSWINTFLFIFILSGLLRAITPFIFLRFIKEVRVGVRPPKQNPFDYLTEDIIPTYLPMVETIHLHVLGRFRGKKRAK